MRVKLTLYHLAVFITGAVGILVYVFTRLGPARGAGVGGAIVMPVVALVYVVAFGILCLLSLAVWLLAAYVRNRRRATATRR